MKTEKNFANQFSIVFLFALACVLPNNRLCAAGLFTSATAADVNSVPTKIDSDILQRRLAHVNFGELKNGTRAGAKLDINLFEGFSLEGTVERMEERSPRNYTLSGHVGDDGVSTFALSVIDDVVAMNVRTKNEFYQVRSLQNGIHEISQMDENKFPECGNGPEQAVKLPAGVAADAPIQAQADTGDIIDVMVVYTPAARVAAGSSNAIHAAINLAVSESNIAYQESQINTRLRLVYAGEVAYTNDSAGFDIALDALTNPSDGVIDQVHTLRNTYGADLVSLWINNSGSCGLGWLMTSLSSGFASKGFSVVHWGPTCATGYYSFGHELAHNMGCQHDRNNASGQGLYDYSYGWQFTGADAVNYRTIMAYAPGTRTQRFSNPNVTYMGTPTGVPSGQPTGSDNAQTINQSALTVANFRPAAPAADVGPNIGIQPQPQIVALGSPATFSVTASGTPPLYYFWKRSETNISGATASSFTILNVQASDLTNYSVVVSNASGFVTSSNAPLGLTLGSVLDNTGFIWTTEGDAPWFGQAVATHDGSDAAESGDIDGFSYSSLSTTIEGPGTLSFWWKVSSEEGADFLDLFLDEDLLDQNGISGEPDWSPRTFAIPAGTHTLTWQYSKDFDQDGGLDKAWVDQVSYVAGSSFTADSLGLTNGQFRLVVNGKAGAAYSLQASTNLINWATISNILSTNVNTIYLDPTTSSNKLRFFRVTSP